MILPPKCPLFSADLAGKIKDLGNQGLLKWEMFTYK